MKATPYESREKEYNKQIEELREWRTFWITSLSILAISLYALLSGFMDGFIGKPIGLSIFKPNADDTIYNPIAFFTLPITVTLLLSPLLLQIRLISKDLQQTLALREDTNTKHTLVLLISSVSTGEFRDKLLEKFFHHSSEQSTSRLIANWGKQPKESSGKGIVQDVKEAIRTATKQERDE